MFGLCAGMLKRTLSCIKALKFWVNKLPLKRAKYLQFYILASFFRKCQKDFLNKRKSVDN